MNDICICELRAEELDGAMELVRQVFCKYVAPGYSGEGVQEFEAYIAPAAAKARLASGKETVLGASENGVLVGVLAYRLPPHISLLFVHPDHHKKGIARRLAQYMENEMKAAGHREIDLNSSPYAKEIYERLGYVPAGEECVTNGMRYIPMLKKL